MKITDVQCLLLSCKILEEQRWTCCGGDIEKRATWAWKRDAVLIKITTDEGITGIGEAMPIEPLAIASTINNLKPLLLKKDPFKVNKLSEAGPWERWRPSCLHLGSQIRALAGINIALWDIIGKTTNQPLYKLLGGGYRDKIKAYVSGGEWKKNPKELAEEALGYVQKGFLAFKMRLGRGLKTDVEMLEAVRKAVGEEMDLMVDNSCLYSVAEAKKVLKALEEYNLLFYEEPIPENQIEGYREIRATTSTPIAGGECFSTVFDFKERIEKRAYDIVQPDCTNTGISEAMKIAFMADLQGMLCVPHLWGNAIGIAATTHFIASTPNGYMIEIDQTYNPMRTEIVDNPVKVEDGYIKVPYRPGLGVELVEEALSKFPYIKEPESKEQNPTGFTVLYPRY